MDIATCSKRPVLVSCSLPDFEYQIDPYIGCSHYCRYCYVLDQAETNWREKILYHDDIVDQLRDELTGIPPQTIYMGYHTDPYQPCELELRQTRQVLELLLEMGFSANILTKSDLVLRDQDLFREMSCANVSVSVAFCDERVRQAFEIDTIETARRIDALQKLRSVDIATSALVCPVIPYLTDTASLVGTLAPLTDVIWVYRLSVQNESQCGWINVKDVLAREFPGHKVTVETAVLTADHYWETLRRDLQSIQEKQNLDLRIHV